MKIKNILKWVVPVISSVVLVYILLTQVDIKEIASSIKNSNPLYLSFFLFFYILLMILRSVRFRMVLNDKIKLSSMVDVVFFQTFLLNLIPFRIGEISYVYYVKKLGKISYHKGLSSLIVTKVFDMSIIITFFIGAVLSTNKLQESAFSNSIPLLLGLLILMFAVLLLLIYRHEVIMKIVDYIEEVLLKISKKFTLVTENAKKVVGSFEEFKSHKLLISTFLQSIIIMSVSMIAAYFLAASVGYLLPINVLIIGGTFSTLSNLLPINGIAGFGTVESVWALVLAFFGYPIESAVVFAFSIHIIQLLSISILGLIGWIRINYYHLK